MKSFFKFTFASILGALLAVVMLVLIGMGILGAIAASADKPVKVKPNSILEIKLDKPLTDRTIDNPFEKINPFSLKPGSTLGLNDILKNIEKAKTDDKIKGIYLNVNAIASNFGGNAMIEEIRSKLLEFKETGKFIVSYNNLGYTQKSYYLCSVADSIFMNPQGFIMFTGMGGEMVFYKKFLKKIGVEPQIVRHGKFKAAVEPFLLEEMSDANREQTMKYVGALWNHILKGISEERGISVEKLNQLTDELTIRKPKAALENKLVDGLIYEDQMHSKLKQLCDLKEKDKLRKITLHKYTKAPGKSDGYSKDKIAVVYASGEIGMQQSSKSIGPDLAASIRKARRDSSVKAIVLRVNSPGGSALTSELIWREVALAADTKPVIASMGNVAASGGYYIACAADTIVAEPNTITGSIGIFALLFSGEDLIKNKLGLTTDSFGTNKFSNFGGGYPIPFLPFSSRKFNKEELAILQEYIEEGYDTFITRVAEGRGIDKKDVDKVGQGRVWAAEDALNIGLVDELGGLEKAIEIAREKAGLEKYRIVSLPKLKDPFEALFEDLTTEVKVQILKSELGDNYKYYQQSQQILKSAGVQARIPYNIELY